jgi:hypothetical protein
MASELEPFRRFGQQVANRLDGFLGHIRHRVPMGVVEALDSRLEADLPGPRIPLGLGVHRLCSVRLRTACGLIRDVRVVPWSL